MIRRILTLLIVISVVGPACSQLQDDQPEVLAPSPAESTETVATIPPMPIVTRTPVDPAQIPATPSGTAADVEIPSTYIVQEGDSLYSIAVRFKLNLAEIVELNGLSDPNDITVGQELVLPVPEE